MEHKHPERKRVSLFLPGLYGGGAERVMLNIASGLAERGYSVDLVLAQAEGPFLSEVPASIRVVELNGHSMRAGRTLASLVPLLRYLRRERPKALLSALHANFVAIWAGRLAGIPERVVISEHNTFSCHHGQLPRRYRVPMTQCVKRFYPAAHRIVAVSRGVADDLAQVARIPRNRIEVIYNPVVTPGLEAKSREKLIHPWFEPGNPPVVLSMGRLTAQKDFSTLIKAFAGVCRDFPARLLILGEGEDRLKLEALVRDLDLEKDVALPGFVQNPFPYMVGASLFVLSSRWEGLPTVLVEALYCGLPVVATDCPSGPREILKDGAYGRLVPVGSPQALTEAIQLALASARRPPCESWQPFELKTVLDHYIRVLEV
jgi:glycosyltransferase involved in cell wall biosynthesis